MDNFSDSSFTKHTCIIFSIYVSNDLIFMHIHLFKKNFLKHKLHFMIINVLYVFSFLFELEYLATTHGSLNFEV